MELPLYQGLGDVICLYGMGKVCCRGHIVIRLRAEQGKALKLECAEGFLSVLECIFVLTALQLQK